MKEVSTWGSPPLRTTVLAGDILRFGGSWAEGSSMPQGASTKGERMEGCFQGEKPLILLVLGSRKRPWGVPGGDSAIQGYPKFPCLDVWVQTLSPHFGGDLLSDWVGEGLVLEEGLRGIGDGHLPNSGFLRSPSGLESGLPAGPVPAQPVSTNRTLQGLWGMSAVAHPAWACRQHRHPCDLCCWSHDLL